MSWCPLIPGFAGLTELAGLTPALAAASGTIAAVTPSAMAPEKKVRMRKFLLHFGGSGFGQDTATVRFWGMISMLFGIDQR